MTEAHRSKVPVPPSDLQRVSHLMNGKYKVRVTVKANAEGVNRPDSVSIQGEKETNKFRGCYAGLCSDFEPVIRAMIDGPLPAGSSRTKEFEAKLTVVKWMNFGVNPPSTDSTIYMVHSFQKPESQSAPKRNTAPNLIS